MTEDEKRSARIVEERLRWWRLEEMARRCKLIAERIWDADLQKAIEEQRATAETLRDRHGVGIRATGQAYEIDKGLMVPVLTPYDRLVFLEKAAVSYMISADRQNIPVTPEGKRAAQKTDGPREAVEAGSGVDETLEDAEAERLAQAGEAPTIASGYIAVSEAPAS